MGSWLSHHSTPPPKFTSRLSLSRTGDKRPTLWFLLEKWFCVNSKKLIARVQTSLPRSFFFPSTPTPNPLSPETRFSPWFIAYNSPSRGNFSTPPFSPFPQIRSKTPLQSLRIPQPFSPYLPTPSSLSYAPSRFSTPILLPYHLPNPSFLPLLISHFPLPNRIPNPSSPHSDTPPKKNTPTISPAAAPLNPSLPPLSLSPPTLPLTRTRIILY